jgi:hypothetical protein
LNPHFFYVDFNAAKSVAGVLADNKVVFFHQFLGGKSRFYLENQEEVEYAIDLIAELDASPVINED